MVWGTDHLRNRPDYKRICCPSGFRRTDQTVGRKKIPLPDHRASIESGEACIDTPTEFQLGDWQVDSFIPPGLD